MTETEGPIYEGNPLSEQTKLELALGKQLVLGSLESANTYSKSMMLFCGTLATLYATLLGLLPEGSLSGVNRITLFLPGLFFIITAVIFAIAYVPQMKTIVINKPLTVQKAYIALLKSKYILQILGTSLFIVSVLILTIVMIFTL